MCRFSDENGSLAGADVLRVPSGTEKSIGAAFVFFFPVRDQTSCCKRPRALWTSSPSLLSFLTGVRPVTVCFSDSIPIPIPPPPPTPRARKRRPGHGRKHRWTGRVRD